MLDEFPAKSGPLRDRLSTVSPASRPFKFQPTASALRPQLTCLVFHLLVRQFKLLLPHASVYAVHLPARLRTP